MIKKTFKELTEKPDIYKSFFSKTERKVFSLDSSDSDRDFRKILDMGEEHFYEVAQGDLESVINEIQNIMEMERRKGVIEDITRNLHLYQNEISPELVSETSEIIEELSSKEGKFVAVLQNCLEELKICYLSLFFKKGAN